MALASASFNIFTSQLVQPWLDLLKPVSDSISAQHSQPPEVRFVLYKTGRSVFWIRLKAGFCYESCYRFVMSMPKKALTTCEYLEVSFTGRQMMPFYDRTAITPSLSTPLAKGAGASLSALTASRRLWQHLPLPFAAYGHGLKQQLHQKPKAFRKGCVFFKKLFTLAFMRNTNDRKRLGQTAPAFDSGSVTLCSPGSWRYAARALLSCKPDAGLR